MRYSYVRCAGWLIILACLSAWAAACASAGGAIEVDNLKDDPAVSAPREYFIAAGDMLNIQVYMDPQTSGKMRVRSDGRITLPLVNDVVAAGKTPVQLARDIETALKSVILSSVLGEVAKPGPQALQRDTGVAEVLAAAGGLTNFAKRDRIFVVRSSPQQVRIHFTYDALTKGIGRAPTFRLRAGDVVVVE
jgi:polysaccharide biosynthesis/export protein